MFVTEPGYYVTIYNQADHFCMLQMYSESEPFTLIFLNSVQVLYVNMDRVVRGPLTVSFIILSYSKESLAWIVHSACRNISKYVRTAECALQL